MCHARISPVLRTVILGVFSVFFYFGDAGASRATTYSNTEQAHFNELEKLRPELAQKIKDKFDKINKKKNKTDDQKKDERKKVLEEELEKANVAKQAAQQLGNAQQQADAQTVIDILRSLKHVHLNEEGEVAIPQRVADEKLRLDEEDEAKKKAEKEEDKGKEGKKAGHKRKKSAMDPRRAKHRTQQQARHENIPPGPLFDAVDRAVDELVRLHGGGTVLMTFSNIDTNFGADADGRDDRFGGSIALNADIPIFDLGPTGSVVMVAGGFLRVYFGPNGEIVTDFHPTPGDDTTLSFDPYFSGDPYVGLRFADLGLPDEPIVFTLLGGPSFLVGKERFTTNESCCGGQHEKFDETNVNVGIHGGVIVDVFAPGSSHALSVGAGASYHQLDIDGNSSTFPFDYNGDTNVLIFHFDLGVAFSARGPVDSHSKPDVTAPGAQILSGQ